MILGVKRQTTMGTKDVSIYESILLRKLTLPGSAVMFYTPVTRTRSLNYV